MKTRVALLFLFAYATFAFAQSNTGLPSFGASVDINDVETVNVGTLNPSIHVPLRSKGGPLPLNIGLWQNSGVYFGPAGGYVSLAATPPNIANGYFSGTISSTLIQRDTLCPDGVSHTTIRSLDSLIDAKTTVHPLPAGAGTLYWDSAGCYHGAVDAFTTDASGYELVIGAIHPATLVGSVYGRSGVNVNNGPFVISDTHGNTVNFASGNYTDGLSSTPVLSTISGGYTYNDGAGALRTITVSAPLTPMLTAFQCANIGNASANFSPLMSVGYPDGSSIVMTWEKTAAQNYDGRLKTVKIRAGATYTHTYSGGTNGDGLWCSQPNNSDPVTNATLTISNGTGTWIFARSADGKTTTVTKPDGSVAVYSFYSATEPVLTNKVIKDTNGTTVLDTVTYCYDSTISSCNPSQPSTHPSVVRAYHYVPGIANPAETATFYDSYSNVTETDSYDFGPTLISKAITVYGSWDTSSSSCVSLASIHITGKPCDVQVQNASGTALSHSRFTYNTSNGNLLYQYDYSSATAFLTTAFLYNTNGTPAQITRADGFQTTLAYNGTGGCNNLLPTSAITPFGTSSATWDCNGALPLTTTDLNGLVVTNTYGDPLYRATQTSDNGGQAPITFTWTSPTQASSRMLFNSGASVSEHVTTMNSLGQVISRQTRQGPSSTNYDTVSFGYDSTGHQTTTSQACVTTLGGTCATAAVTNAYDGLSRPKTQTVNTATHGVTTYTYTNGDVNISSTPAPTGENAKTVQIEYDGLGRKTRTCAITGLGGSAPCGERATGSGYLAKYTLDALGRATQISQNAQGTALNTNLTYDMLSRITQETVPETGTSSFVYDTQLAACTNVFATNLPGHLSQSTDGAGNILCYHYDGPSGLATTALLGTFAVSGPNLANTANRNFAYGVSGQGGTTNSVGRLYQTATTTTPGCGGSNSQSASFYSYDLYGRVSQVQQTSCGLSNSTQYFTTTATYWDNGQIKTLGGIPGVSTITYGLDGEGRATSATSGATTLVSSVAYNAAANPTTITYGTGDIDTYAWDSNTQNMTQYQFKLNGVTDTGTPTWNPNGTLGSLAIADSISATDTQTCTTGHDDLVRITSFNCAAKWNTSYSYTPDYAGNVTKSGSVNFAPGYTAANNRMLAPFTYDAKGNMLHDSTLAFDYGWDMYGAMASIGGTAEKFITDALGSVVERTGSPHLYYPQSPAGGLGAASSLTAASSIRIPLPGGQSQAVFSGAAITINHLDWMGSARLTTNFTARTLNSVFCYGPMGEVYCGTAANSEFEGQFQDSKSGLFDFDAARYSGTQGRSVSPTGGSNGYVMDNSPF